MRTRSQAVVGEYDRLARRYDRRWAYYVRASAEATARRIHVRPGERLLDVGCGTGVLLELLAGRHPEVRLAGVDPSREMLGIARARLPAVVFLGQAYAERLPFDDHAFDVIASISAFHYFSEPADALREMCRVLRPGGRVVVTDWCEDYLACRLCGLWLRGTNRPYHRLYGSRECRDLVAGSGLASVAVERFKISWLWGLMTATGVHAAP